MKHLITAVLVAIVASLCAFGMSSCQAIGFGESGEGIPQLGDAKATTPALSEAGTLRVGVDAANAPFSTLVDGKMVGINVDIAAALADEMGLKVRVVDVGADAEAALDKGTVDVVLGMDSADTAATCWLSDPYLSTAVAIFATSSGSILPTAASKPVIEAQESSMSAWEITNQFGEDALKAVPDLRTVFEDLEKGSVSYAAADAIIGSYVSHTSGGKAQIIGLMQKAGGYCVGVAASNNDLKTVITEAVSALRNSGVVDVIESKWIGQVIKLDAIALTEAAAKGEALATDPNKESSLSDKNTSTLGTVGGNAVDLQDDGSAPGEGGDTTATTDGYWGYTDPGYVDPGYTDPGYTDPGYVDPGYTDPGYTDPGTGDAGGAGTEDYVEGAGTTEDAGGAVEGEAA